MPFKIIITKTRLYNFDPLKPHFCIVKLGFTGVYILFLLKNIDCGYKLEHPRRGGSNEYPQSIFWAEIWKISEFLYLKIFSFWRWNFLYIAIGDFFVMIILVQHENLPCVSYYCIDLDVSIHKYQSDLLNF